MKKVFLALCVFAAVSSAQAQPPKFGLKAGLNVSSTNNNTSGTSGTRLGFHAGVLSHIHLSPEWSLQPEVMYSGQGAKVGDVNLNLGYINVPLLVQYNFDNGFRLQTGPQLGILIDVKDNVNGTPTNYFSKNDFNSTDFAWSFGLGYLTESGLGIDGRYNLGYINVPLLVQYNFDNGFRLQTGPQLGFLIDVKDNVNGTPTNYFSKNDFNSTDFAWSFGLGYLTESGLGIDGRYNLGLSNVRNPMGAGAGKTTSRVFQVGLFYLLDHSHKRKSR